jgi:FtsP/CotA-like multicopper oxidase with cupredoxin domain
MKTLTKHFERLLGLSAALLAFGAGPATAAIDGIGGPNFNLTAKADYVSTADGQSLLAWGYANCGQPANCASAQMQYPGPTLIVNQGDQVTITLTSQLPVASSIVFPGQMGVAASGGAAGEMTNEAVAGGASTVTYTFTAGQPGTYMYHSGTRPDVQVEMGLMGALIVRPSGAYALSQAYGHGDSAFDYEYLFLLSEMDPKIHERVALAGSDQVDTSDYLAVLWFINGRNGPDTLSGPNLPWMPTQPYNIVPRAHPGDQVLLRLIGAGRDPHPFHTHGNNHVIIARDGRLLASAPGLGADLAESNYTVTVSPGSTYDALFTWTGKGLGWDIYGADSAHEHSCNGNTVAQGPTIGFDPVTGEWCPDHGKALQVFMPSQLDMANGAYWSGSPYLGTAGALPPGEGGFNINAGYFYMWHSHTEKELTNHDVFPGGMMTMFIVEPPGVVIE